MAGAFDMSFSSTATCEIFSLDPPNVLERRGVEVESHERFHRLVWGALPNSGEEYPLGVIAGGLVDGSVNLFNPGMCETLHHLLLYLFIFFLVSSLSTLATTRRRMHARSLARTRSSFAAFFFFFFFVPFEELFIVVICIEDEEEGLSSCFPFEFASWL